MKRVVNPAEERRSYGNPYATPADTPAPSHDDAPAALSRDPTGWRFRADLEGLRGIAVLLVVLYHARVPFARAGYLGVDVFFTLSGFLITGILVEEFQRTGGISLSRFWARRARRLLPAAFVVAAFVTVATWLVRAPYRAELLTNSLRSFAVYASNALFAHRALDYFAPQAHLDPLLHTWSLSVEEQFYLLFAPALLLPLALGRRIPRSNPRRIAVLALGAATVASFVAALVLAPVRPATTFYMLPARGWELGAGGLVALAMPQITTLSDGVAGALALGALCLVMFGAGALGGDSAAAHLPLITLTAVVGAAGIVAFGARRSIAQRILEQPILRRVGALSYSWYLWHWPLLVLLAERVQHPSMTVRLAVAFGALAPAILSYRYVEKPIRTSRKLAHVPVRSLALVPAFAALVWTLGTLNQREARRHEAAPALAAITRARAGSTALYATPGCHARVGEDTPGQCVFDGPSDTSIVIFGDSHAAALFPAVEAIARRRHWQVVPFTKSACPAVDLPVLHQGAPYTECDRWRSDALRRIRRLQPSVIVMSQSHAQELVMRARGTGWLDSSQAARARFGQGIGRTLAELPSRARIIVVRDVPFPGYDVPSCLAEHLDREASCDTERSAVDARAVAAIERAAIADTPNARWLDLTASFCDDTTCAVSRGGVPLYYDSEHVTVGFATTFATAIGAALSDETQRASARARLHD